MGNDDLFTKIFSNGRFFRLLCDNTNNAIAITTFQSKQFIYWNKRMEALYGQGFHRKTWAELSPYAEELSKDIVMCEDVVNNVTPEDYYFIKKHYTNHLTGEVWFAACEFYHIGAIEIEGQLQDVFLCLIRKIEPAMDPKELTPAVKAELIRDLKRSVIEFVFSHYKPALGLIAAVITALYSFIQPIATKHRPSREELISELLETTKQLVATSVTSTNKFE